MEKGRAKKGEKAIRILALLIRKKKEDDNKKEQEQKEKSCTVSIM